MPGIKEVCRLVRFHAQIDARVGLFFRSFLTAFGVVSRKMNVPALVSTLWLNEQMMAPDFLQSFRVLDATWDLPMFKRDFKKEHETERIPGARYFSLSECSDPSSTLPHMLPTAEDFAKYVSNLGVENKHHVILYDNSVRFGIFSAPRVWWTFKVFGQEKVSVLDGGLPKWVKDGLKTTSGPYGKDDKLPAPTSQYKATFRPELVKDFGFIRSNVDSKNPVQVVDARSSGRFKGIAPEPRPDIPSGHIAKTTNIPFFDCFNDAKTMKKPEELQKVFEEAGIDLDKDVVATCGSGVTACVLAYAAFVAKGKEVPVYDGAWVEWALKVPDLIITEKPTIS